MDVETRERELIVTRTFEAPRTLVFEAYSDCRHLMQWWGPGEWPLVSCDMDFREGGTWQYCMKGPEGDLSCGKAVYQEIRKPEKIVYTDYFTDEEGTVNEEMPAVQNTVTFADQDGKTVLTARTLFETPDALQSTLDMGVIEGFTITLDQLEAHLAELQTQAIE